MRVQVPSCILQVLLFLILSQQTSPQNFIREEPLKNKLSRQSYPYVPAEKFQFRHLTKENGLSDNNITCMLQDRKGFIWIGTPEGLNRYDSRKVKVFKHSPDDPNSLGDGGVFALCEDRSGVLWIGTGGGGLNKYNPGLENFTRYINPEDSSEIQNFILSIYEDKSGILWVGTQYNGIFSFNRETAKVEYYKNIPGDPTSLGENRIWTFFEDSRNNLWVGTLSAGLNKFDRVNKKFTRYLHDPDNPGSISFNTIAGIREDKSGNIWIATFGGGLNKLIYKENKYSPVFKHYKYDPKNSLSINDNYLVFIHIDEDNVIWLGTSQGGLNKSITNLDENPDPSFISCKHDPMDQFSLGGNYVSWIYQDNSGLLWIANQGEGLNILNTRQKQFRHFNHDPENPYSLNSNDVTAICEDKNGIIWVGTYNSGLNKWDRISNKFTHYKNNPEDPNSISDNRVTSIYEDKSGILWIGTYFGGLNKFDRKREKFYAYRHDPSNPGSIIEDIVISIAEDTSGILWIGTPDNGLQKFDKKKGVFTYIKYKLDDTDDFSSTYAASLCTDRSGKLWISARLDGLFVFDYKEDNFIHYENSPDNTNSLSSNVVNVIYEDKSSTFWFGTSGSGLDRFDKKNNRFKHYRMKDGLPSDVIIDILEDEVGNLWISTDIGLSRFNPVSGTFRNYDTEDGLPTPGFWAACKSKTGEFIFGCSNGFIIFHPDSIKEYAHAPRIYITDFLLFNKPVPIGYDSLSKRTILEKSIIYCKELKLDYDDKVFSLEFAALDFQAPERYKYAYILEGFDNDWVYTDPGRTLVTYTNLDPGEYFFKIRGSDKYGIWNESGASIKIIILPPWWRTVWAYFIYFVLAASTIYILWKGQLKRVKIKHEFEMTRFEAHKLQEVDEMKTRFFTNISHEFRTPLTLILGPVKQIIEKIQDDKIRNELKIVHKNANKLLVLVNQLLDISKIELGFMKLQAAPLNIISLLKTLILSFSAYSERKRITLNFHPAEDEIIVYMDRDKIEKIITNLFSNAFKFTPDGGEIDITVTRNVNQCIITVSDNGIGIPGEKLLKIFDRFYQVDSSHIREHEGTGIGLSLTKELVELHKGSIKVESEEGKGTIVIICFPLGKEHLKPGEICETEPGTGNEVSIEPDAIRLKEKNKIDAGLYMNDAIPTLLIIDDNSEVREYIRSIMGKEYNSIEASDGDEGWKMSLSNIPDLIISDIMMPKIDGFRLCEMLKKDERTSHIPVILLTAKAAKEDKLEGYETGADEYIMKPFEPDELKARIKNLIEQRERLHCHFQREGILGLNQSKITSVDKKFMHKAYEIISQNLSNEEFSVELFAQSLSVSKSLLHKKITSLTGEPPVEFIRRIRLNKAAFLIENKFGNVSQVAFEVGFNNPAYFSECFKKQFGVSPSQYKP